MPNFFRNCTTCFKPIYFRQNSEGKWVPFDVGTHQCHYETCIVKPNVSETRIRLMQQERELNRACLPYEKHKISFESAIKCKKLKDFGEVEK